MPTHISREPSTRRSLPRNVKLLGLVSLLNDTASEMLYPLLPAFFMSVLGGGKTGLGLLEGCAESVASLLKLWAGGRSDRVGRRKRFVVVGYALPAIARPVIGLAGSLWHVFGLRLVDRIGKGIRSAPRDAIIAESTDATMRGRAFGFHRAMDHLGAVLGPLLATAVLASLPHTMPEADRLRLLFLLTLVPGMLVALVVLRLREQAASVEPAGALTFTLSRFDGNFRRYLLALLLFTLGNSSDAFLLVRAGEVGVPLAFIPALWAVFHVLKSVGNLWAGRAVDRHGARPLLVFGWALYAAIYVGFAAATAAWHVWALFLGYALFYALTEPAEKTLVVNLVGQEGKGLAYGWFHLTIGIGALPSSLLFGWLYHEFGAWWAFGTGAVLAFVASGLLCTVKMERASSD